ncbi:MAG: ATP synthase F1 subunit epsilon [Candidatus Omnitrophota bacterium]
MAATYPLQIVTHEETVYSGEVESLIAPGALGYLGILAHHAPLLTPLTEGTITIRDAQEETKTYWVKGGILEVANSEAVILAENIGGVG